MKDMTIPNGNPNGNFEIDPPRIVLVRKYGYQQGEPRTITAAVQAVYDYPNPMRNGNGNRFVHLDIGFANNGPSSINGMSAHERFFLMVESIEALHQLSDAIKAAALVAESKWPTRTCPKEDA